MKRISSKGDLQKTATIKGDLQKATSVRRNHKLLTDIAKEAANMVVTTSAIISSTHDQPALAIVGATISLVASSASLVSIAASVDEDEYDDL